MSAETVSDPNICFVRKVAKNFHEIAKSRRSHISEHLVKLNNYDHLTADLFNKLKAVLNDLRLSRFKKPIPKICLACCKYLEDLESEENAPTSDEKTDPCTSSKTSRSTSFQELLLEIKTQEFTNMEMNILMQAVGERLAPVVNKHVTQINKTNLGNRFDEMKTMTYQSYWENTCDPLKRFLLGTMNGVSKRMETEEMKSTRIRLATHAMETIFAMINLNYTSAIILTEMLYMYFLSNSRRVCEIYGNVTGGGSSTTLRNVLERISENPTKVPGNGYVVMAFDNNQVIGKTHRVELDSKIKVSSVTSIAAFECVTANIKNPQESKMTFPLLHQLSSNHSHALNQKMQQFTSQSMQLVNEYLIKFLNRRLTFIQSTLSDDGMDYVDKSSDDIPNTNEGLPYDDIADSASDCRIYDQECLMVNPNSYKTVAEVLAHIQKIALIGERRWVTVVVDGVPFCLAQDIIRKSVRCHICKLILLEEDVSSHFTEKHGQPSPSHLERAFTNILLRPGAGHYEMNMVKALFAGWFPLYLEPITELLGFLSPKAKMCVENCTDHHKAWQILEIAFESISDELLYSYAKTCRLNSIVPSVENFFEKVKNSQNENVKAAFQFVYYWSFSILLFRAAIRKNNFEVAIKAREQGSGLFYAFRHPKYQLINCYDIAELVQMPEEVRRAVYRESMVIPGSGVGQGVDFLLEQRNRRMKNYVVRNGIPTSDQWKAASSSMQRLDEIINTVENRLNMQISSSHSKYDLSREKRAARKLFRSHGIFDTSKDAKISYLPNIQHENGPFNSILRCQLLAETNRRMFYEGVVTTGNMQKGVNAELKSSDKEKLKQTYWRVYNLFEDDDDD